MESFFVLLIIMAIGDYVLGIIGFFRAVSAHAQLRILRRELMELRTLPREPVSTAPNILPPEPMAAPIPLDVQVIPPIQPEPDNVVEPVTNVAPLAKPPRDIEALFAARWGVWLGSAALLFAGIFLIRYAVEESLLGPGARCALAALLGATLLEAQVTGTAPRLGLFLLSPLAVWRGATEPRVDRLPWIASLFGLLTLLLWALPAWNPTGETITVEGIVEAVLPGAWAPDVIRPLITAASLFAAFHAAAGLWLERHARHPLHWAALTAAVPVLTLAVAFAQIARFQTSFAWAFAALALAAALTLIAARAAADAAPQRAGVHAAGAVAALALGCAMLLHDHWLTLAIALYLPALALIEAKADLPPPRKVALVVAVLVMVRLVLNWYALDYAYGATPFANGLLAAHAAPGAAFAIAAFLFRKCADDLLVALLEAGAITLAAIFVAAELRQRYQGGQFGGAMGFDETALHLLTLAVQACVYLALAQRTGRAMFDWAWRIMGVAALAVATCLIVLNPALTGAFADVVTLLAAYLVPAGLAIFAWSRLADAKSRRVLGVYAVVAGFAWITLQIRLMFHPGHMSVIDGRIGDAELWSWSGAWLVYAIGLMVLGVRTGQRAPRLAALGVVGLVCVKVFLVDMPDLIGLWRVLSFLGLGLALIGLGVAYRRFVLPARNAVEAMPAGVEGVEVDMLTP